MKLRTYRTILFAGILLLLTGSLHVSAQVTVSNMFTDGMVLQQNTDVAIWGWANPGDTIAVSGSWNNKTVKTATDSGRKWFAKLTTPVAKTDGTSYTITIRGTNTLVLKDVLVGEVWLLSGQSNMEMSLEGWLPNGIVEGSAQAIAAANYPRIRLLVAGKKSSVTPQANITKNWTNGSWTACSPASVKSFSAVGYFFGKELHTELNIPIGLVLSAWGGSSCETWANPSSLNFVNDFKNKGPWSPTKTDDNQSPTLLYNGMIAPLIPFTFAGVCWYQGETNVGKPQQFTELFPAMIEGWRSDFQKSDLPFYFVQLAPWGGYGGTSLPELWEAQSYAQLLKNCGMAGTLDVGDNGNIHPARKEPVGHRLALWALAKNYAKSSLDYSGPQYRSMQIEGNKIRISFDYTSNGLKAVNNSPDQFEIAGSDLVFLPAKTLIDGNTLLVWSDNLNAPKQVRYAWSGTATASLYNTGDLPATPFRTNTPAYLSAVRSSFLIDSEIIKAGESTNISWTSIGASEITLNGNPVSSSGKMTVKPESNTSYILVAKSGQTTVSKTINLSVIPNNTFNWSLNKTATSSGNASGSSPALACDGIQTTGWKSTATNNQWISADLGEIVPVENVVLYWGDAYGKGYQVQVSDDNLTWKTIFTETNGDGRVDNIQNLKTSCRYVKILGTTMATVNGFNLNELEIYSLKKPIFGALKDKNGATMRGTPMVLGKAFPQSVAFAQNIENWKYLRNNGFNTIRVCWVDPWYKTHGYASWSVAEVLPYLDKCVQNATETGMNLIINFHNVGAQQEFDKSYQFTQENDFWTAVAPRYKDNDLVYYEPVNEPTFTASDYLKADFKESYLKLYNNIRLLAPQRPILFFSFNGITPEIITVVENYQAQIDWTNTAVGYHMYNSATSASIRTVMAYHPVICTEWFYNYKSKLPGNGFIKQVDGFKENAQTLEKIGSGWIDWRDWDDVILNETIDTLIGDARLKNYWWGKPISGLNATGISLSDRKIQLVSGMTKKLIAFPLPALAEDQKINWTSSDSNLATVDANGLVTAVSSRNATATITAKTNDGNFAASCELTILATQAKVAYPDGIPQKIPGTINVTYFDQGGEGIGYHDLTKTNDGNGIRPNEAVDTQVLLPEGNIGGIATGEWLEYTVEVLQEGFYTFEIQFATAGKYGKFHIEFDGIDKTGQLPVATTSSYSKFMPKKITGIELKKGVQVMRIFFDYGEYNLGTITVSREIPSGFSNTAMISMHRIYPSPTRDRLTISGPGLFKRYSIMNLYGQLIRQGFISKSNSLDVSFLSAGNYLLRLENDQMYQTEKFIKL